MSAKSDEDLAVLDFSTATSVSDILKRHVIDNDRCTFFAILALGDNFYEDGVTSVGDEQWQTTWKDVWEPQVLALQWFPVLGNHDYHSGIDGAQAQVDRTTATDDEEWQMPGRSYTTYFFSGRVAVVAIDTIELAPLDMDEETAGMYGDPTSAIRDVERELSNAFDQLNMNTNGGSSLLIVMGHYPVLSVGEHGDSPTLAQELLPLFQRYAVDAYLCGHDHTMQHSYLDEVHYIVSGNGAKHGTVDRGATIDIPSTTYTATSTRVTNYAAVVPGFASHAVNFDNGDLVLSTQFIDTDGKTRHSFSQTARCKSHCEGQSSTRHGFTDVLSSVMSVVRSYSIVLSMTGFAAFLILCVLCSLIFRRKDKESKSDPATQKDQFSARDETSQLLLFSSSYDFDYDGEARSIKGGGPAPNFAHYQH